MWNFYISPVKKGEGLLHACISSLPHVNETKTLLRSLSASRLIVTISFIFFLFSSYILVLAG
jgi:hypothetical protein